MEPENQGTLLLSDTFVAFALQRACKLIRKYISWPTAVQVNQNTKAWYNQNLYLMTKQETETFLFLCTPPSC